MRHKTASRLAWGLFMLFVVLLASGMTLAIVAAIPGAFQAIAFVIPFSIFALVGAVVASRRPDNPIGWMFVSLGLGPALGFFGFGYARWALFKNPGSLPFGGAAAWLTAWAWSPILLILLLLLLFPTGKLPSRRWKPLAWINAALVVTGTIAAIFMEGPVDPEELPGIDNPIGIHGMKRVSDLAFVLAGPLLVASAVSIVIRYRKASGDERQQIKWFAFGAVIAGVALPVSDFVPTSIGDWLAFTAFLSIGVGAGIAILRYRLYDIDIVINKTLVYGFLAAFVTAVYLGIVVGIGALVGSQGSLPLSIAATALIALAFQPVRQRAQKFVNRLVYGKRATPYEVLSDFSQIVGRYSSEEVLPQMADLVREATGAERSEVWLRVGSQLQPRASSPADLSPNGAVTPLELNGDGLPTLPGADVTLPLAHRDELLGALSLRMPHRSSFDPVSQKLLGDFAPQAALVLRNVRLLAELQASRQRLVSAQNEERRKLERDLHDGAQQQLVALKVQLGLAQRLSEDEKLKTMLGRLQSSTDETIDALRDLARGIYPPVLADQGLLAALNVQASKAQQRVSLSQDDIGRYPQAIEAAVYFCCLEAMQNAAKHAAGASVEVHLHLENGSLVFEVKDEGPGFNPETVKRGSGLQNMTDRVEALGGKLNFVSFPGEGTLVRGAVPIPDSQSAS